MEIQAERKVRLEYLDGLRGYAALAVVFCHLICAFAIEDPMSGNFVTLQKANSFIKFLFGSPVSAIFDGTLAVNIFFIHSGIVLSLPYFSTKDQKMLMSSSVRRYFRLTGPVAFSVIISYLLMHFGLLFHEKNFIFTNPDSFLSRLYMFPPSFIDSIYQAFYGAYFNFNLNSTYNAVLWTISTELYGSFFVFSFLSLFGELRNRWIVYYIASLLLFQTNLFAFLIGVFIADCYINDIARCYFKIQKTNIYIWSAMLLVGMSLGTANRYKIPEYNLLNLNDSSESLEKLINQIGASLIILSVFCSASLQSFLSMSFSKMLGRISFSMYLIHLLVICSFTCFLAYELIVRLHTTYTVACIVSSLCTIPLIFILSLVMYRFVDIQSIKYANIIYIKFFKLI